MAVLIERKCDIGTVAGHEILRQQALGHPPAHKIKTLEAVGVSTGDPYLGMLFFKQARRRQQADIVGTEYWFAITVAERFEPVDSVKQLKVNLIERNFG